MELTSIFVRNDLMKLLSKPPNTSSSIPYETTKVIFNSTPIVERCVSPIKNCKDVSKPAWNDLNGNLSELTEEASEIAFNVLNRNSFQHRVPAGDYLGAHQITRGLQSSGTAVRRFTLFIRCECSAAIFGWEKTKTIRSRAIHYRDKAL